MQLSLHFSLAELTVSQTADRLGVNNDPDEATVMNLQTLCHGLEMIRVLAGGPIFISSGYRSPVVNASLGSKPTSQHVLGQAADITCPAYGDPKSLLKLILAHKLPYDQAILEYYQPATWDRSARGWVHVSFVKGTPRMQALVIDQEGVRSFA